jgi:crossover junction endodeoxyribonuclease RuvC
MVARPDARVLGLDPGLVALGFGLLESTPTGPVVLAAGVLQTSARRRLEERVQQIYDAVAALLDRHVPAAVALEDLYSEYRFPRTALLMAHARGVVCLAARQRAIRVLAIAPGEVKRAVTGNGAAGKDQVGRSVQRLLGLGRPPRPSHVADALALAFTGLSRLGFRIGGGATPPPIPPRLTQGVTTVAVAPARDNGGATPPPIPPRLTRGVTTVAVAPARDNGGATPPPIPPRLRRGVTTVAVARARGDR